MLHRNDRSKGFTLAEAMMAMVVLGIAAAGVLLPFTGGAAAYAEGTRRTLGAKLAADLMEKVVNEPFEDIVANYNYTEAQGQVKDSAGSVFTDSHYAGISRAVSSVPVYVSQESGSLDAKFILVTVRVYYHGNEIVIVRRLISK